MELAQTEPEFAAATAADGGAAGAGGFGAARLMPSCDFRSAAGAACCGGVSMRLGGVSGAARQMVGTSLPAVPPAALRELILTTARALEPIAAAATAEAGEGEGDDDDEEEEDEAAGAQLAVVGLGGALLCKASALLAPAEAVQGGGAGGGAADASARGALREAMGALLQRVT